MASKFRNSSATLTSKKSSSRESSSMEELLKKYSTGHVGLSMGDKVRGRILAIEKGRVIIDIGGKSEGLVAEKAYNEAEKYIRTLKVGEEVDATVLIPETPDGFTILSFRRAAEDAAWRKVEEAQEGKTPIVVHGKNVTSAGLIVEVFGLSGFIPNSQLGKQVSKDKNALVNAVFQARVIDVDRAQSKVILSEKEISEAEDIELGRKAFKVIREGEVFDAEVTTIYDFGCFVKIEAEPGKGEPKVPLEGLVHISELSWDKVDVPLKVIKIGDKVKVKLLAKKDGKLAFSIKQVQSDPWDKIEEKYQKDERTKGTVVKQSDFGIFIQLEPGIEGLVHITRIPPGKNFKLGDEVNVYVEEIDKKEKKISLGLVLTEKPVGYK